MHAVALPLLLLLLLGWITPRKLGLPDAAAAAAVDDVTGGAASPGILTGCLPRFTAAAAAAAAALAAAAASLAVPMPVAK
jgi:hypothetical protein